MTYHTKSNILSGTSRFTVSDYRQRELDHADIQPLKITCGLCGKAWEGQTKKVRTLAFEHREKKHPETLERRTKRTRRSLTSFRYVQLDEQDIKEIKDERKKRAFLNGVEVDG